METQTSGRVQTEAVIEGLTDRWAVERGLRSADQARRIVVPDALVDDDTMLLSLPPALIRRLGLERTTSVHVTRRGVRAVMYEAVRLTIMGRSCTMDVLEAPDGAPVLIGRIPLLSLDLVIDLREYKLTGNPAHGGEWICDLY